ncbi:MAG: hypothetical protein Q4G26_11825, partial [Paracoccus sp. (in: a-proteobacteria)]|nr:hypothetical protein [Paracoccus sp. (in: a-proteobacteria)]
HHLRLGFPEVAGGLVGMGWIGVRSGIGSSPGPGAGLLPVLRPCAAQKGAAGRGCSGCLADQQLAGDDPGRAFVDAADEAACEDLAIRSLWVIRKPWLVPRWRWVTVTRIGWTSLIRAALRASSLIARPPA